MTTTTTTTTTADPSGLVKYYSHSFYGNGFVREDCNDDDAPPKLLSFETGFYGLALDINDLTKLYYRPFVEDDETNLTYLDCLSSSPASKEGKHGSDRMKELTECLLNMEVTVNEKTTYTFRGAKPPNSATKPFNGTVVMWEAGKISQRFELIDLIFKATDDSEQPDQLVEGTWSLTVQVWPDAFCLTLSGKDVSEVDSYTVTLQAGDDWNVTQCCATPVNSQVDVSLSCIANAESRDDTISQLSKVTVTTNDVDNDGIVLDTTFNEKFSSYETAVVYTQAWSKAPGKLVRKFKGGYTDIRDYDDFDIQVDLEGADECSTVMIPYILAMSYPANVTGMCPMLLVNGVPSGIPVQCSKNWHWAEVGAYAKLYVILPATTNEINNYVLRISYGFYGTLPSASVAQLCLFGYGNKAPTGRWDQMAIGCWGETLCLDSELSCNVQGPITDVRGLFFLDKAKSDETEKQKWSWSNCAWGGDWLRVFDGTEPSKRLYARNVKAAYVAHGPCLTHIRYHGFYGCHHKDQVEFEVNVRTLRTDDYCRTFFDFNYQVHDAVSLKNGYLHNLLNRAFHTPTVIHGNFVGMSGEHSPPDGLTNNQTFVENEAFVGIAPFWISFPDSQQFPPNNKDAKQMPDGTKHMIIRSFQANVGETCYTKPAFSLVNEITRWGDQGDKPSLMANIELPDGLQDLQAGDSISMTTEWVTLSRKVDDYYGPNTQYKSFLAKNPTSWQVPFRDVQLNGSLLTVTVVDDKGGKLVSTYPIKVQVTSDEGVTLSMKAGAGAMPMEFCGLIHTNYRLYQINQDENTGEETETMLDQSTHEDKNDYWQTDFDFQTMTYTMTFNPMMGMDISSWASIWRLKKYV